MHLFDQSACFAIAGILLLPHVRLTAAQITEDNPSCFVCGENGHVFLPNVIAANGSNCGEMETIGRDNGLSPDLCSRLQALVEEECGCFSLPAQPPAFAPFDTALASNPSSEISCSICGVGKQVFDPEAIFTFPNQLDTISCSELQAAGAAGFIRPSACSFLPDVVADPCKCQPIGCPQISPAMAPTSAYPLGYCSVCGPSLQVTNPSANVSYPFPFYRDIQCDDLEREGASGNLTPEQCQLLPSLTSSACDCQPLEGNPPCNVCGDGFMSIPCGIAFLQQQTINGRSSLRCDEIEEYGRAGMISPEMCIGLQEYSSYTGSCGCPLVPAQSPFLFAQSPFVQIFAPVYSYEEEEEEKINSIVYIVGTLVVVITIVGGVGGTLCYINRSPPVTHQHSNAVPLSNSVTSASQQAASEAATFDPLLREKILMTLFPEQKYVSVEPNLPSLCSH